MPNFPPNFYLVGLRSGWTWERGSFPGWVWWPCCRVTVLTWPAIRDRFTPGALLVRYARWSMLVGWGYWIRRLTRWREFEPKAEDWR